MFRKANKTMTFMKFRHPAAHIDIINIKDKQTNLHIRAHITEQSVFSTALKVFRKSNKYKCSVLWPPVLGLAFPCTTFDALFERPCVLQ